MTVNRALPTTTTDPGGVSGTSYADQVAEEVEALWRIGIEPLTSVAGTNTITATPLITGTGFAAYETGNRFSLIPAATNTGAVTVNVAGRGAKSLKDASGAALDAGALVSGTLYVIEYDGTDFRVTSAPDVEIGAKINALTAKTTPVDADTVVISDSAASNVGKKVTIANLRTALNSGLTLVGEDEPTSDVSSISETGLSAYRDVTVGFALHANSSGSSISLQARASGGTWRTIYTTPSTFAGSGGKLIGSLHIYNFGRSNNIKLISGNVVVTDSSNLDRSDALDPSATTTATAIFHVASWSEQWDEFQAVPSTGSFEGSSSDQRAYVAYWGEGEGD